MMKTDILFEEVQGSGKKSVQDFFKVTTLLFAAALIFNLFRQKGEVNNVTLGLLTGGVLCALGAIFNNTRLITQIRSDGIYVRFPPLQSFFAKFLWDDIEEVYIRQFNALTEYNGWGIKTGISGRGYIVSGDKGLQIVFKNGARVLISTSRPEEIERVLEEMKVK